MNRSAGNSPIPDETCAWKALDYPREFHFVFRAGPRRACRYHAKKQNDYRYDSQETALHNQPPFPKLMARMTARKLARSLNAELTLARIRIRSNALIQRRS